MKNSQMITAVTACFIAVSSTFTSFAMSSATGPALEIEQGGEEAVAESQPTTDEAGHLLTRQTPDGQTATYAGEFRATAYSAEEYGHSRTASGVYAQLNHTIAADTSVFPMGTKLLIGDVVYTVEDTGSAIRGNRVDIYLNTNRDCYNFGVRNVSVYRVE